MKWEKATVWVSRCPLCRLGAEPRTSPGRCRCLASRLLGPRLRAAHPLPAHARERALASRQPGALSQALPRRRNRAHSAPNHRLPSAAAEEGWAEAGSRITRTREANQSARGHTEALPPNRPPPPSGCAWGSGCSSPDGDRAPGDLGQGYPAPGTLSNSLHVCA